MSNLDAILFELADTESAPTPARVRDYLERFPEHAVAISEFAAEWALADEPTSEADASVVEALALRGKSNYLNQVGAAPVATDPFEKLTVAAITDLCLHLGVNKPFLAVIRNRGIEPDDLPPLFTRRLATELATPEAAVLDFLAAEPTLSRATRYKSDKKPQARPRMSFDAAAKQSGLTPNQIAALKQS